MRNSTSKNPTVWRAGITPFFFWVNITSLSPTLLVQVLTEPQEKKPAKHASVFLNIAQLQNCKCNSKVLTFLEIKLHCPTTNTEHWFTMCLSLFRVEKVEMDLLLPPNTKLLRVSYTKRHANNLYHYLKVTLEELRQHKSVTARVSGRCGTEVYSV